MSCGAAPKAATSASPSAARREEQATQRRARRAEEVRVGGVGSEGPASGYMHCYMFDSLTDQMLLL